MMIDSPSDFSKVLPKLTSTQKSDSMKFSNLNQVFEESVIEKMSKIDVEKTAGRCVQNIFRSMKMTGNFPEKRGFRLTLGPKIRKKCYQLIENHEFIESES